MSLRDEFEDLWSIPSNVTFSEALQLYTWNGYPNTLINERWESFCDGARAQQKRIDELRDVIDDIWACANSGYSLDDLKSKIALIASAQEK